MTVTPQMHEHATDLWQRAATGGKAIGDIERQLVEGREAFKLKKMETEAKSVLSTTPVIKEKLSGVIHRDKHGVESTKPFSFVA
jgi:hypothetical protein